MVSLSRVVIFITVLVATSANASAANIREAKQSYLFEGIARQNIAESMFSISDYPSRTKPEPRIIPMHPQASIPPVGMRISAPADQKAVLSKKSEPQSAPIALTSSKTPPKVQNKKFIVYFELGRAKLGPGEQEQLDFILKEITAGHVVEIEGYTCKLGPQTINDRIAAVRAQVVKDFLESKGVTVSRSEGHGKHCYMSNINQLNRRVEIEIKSREN